MITFVFWKDYIGNEREDVEGLFYICWKKFWLIFRGRKFIFKSDDRYIFGGRLFIYMICFFFEIIL